MNTDRPDVDALADLDAGIVGGADVDDATAARLRARATADPESAAVLEALAATRTQLGAAPGVPVPPAAATRWAAAIARERAAGADGPLADAPPDALPGVAAWRRPRRVLAAAAAAAVVAVAVAVVVGVRGRAVDTGPELGRVQLAATARGAVGSHDAGGLDDPRRRATCLAAVHPPAVPPDAALVGAMRVTYDGTPGVLLVLGTGRLGVFEVVVVDRECGAGGGHLLATERVP